MSNLQTKNIHPIIQENIDRKSKFVDQVQFIEGIPLFSWIDINPTELCNRQCVFCPRVDPKIYPNQNLNMSIESAATIASELKALNFKGGVIFSGYGEPILNKKLVDIVSVFGNEIHTELVTSGDRLTSDLAEALYRAGLDIILVSLYDGPEQRTEFEGVFKKINASPEQYLLRDRWYDTDYQYGLKLTNRAGKVDAGNQEPPAIDRTCYYPYYSLQIDWNGDVLLCVQDWTKEYVFGNIHETSLFDIWKNSGLADYRKQLQEGRRSLSPCMQCNVDGQLHGSKHFAAWTNHSHSTV